MAKYGKEDGFNDPVVRCTECSKVFARETLRDKGMCPACGNKRVRNCLTFSETEMESLKNSGVDPDFIALFEGVEENAL